MLPQLSHGGGSKAALLALVILLLQMNLSDVAIQVEFAVEFFGTQLTRKWPSTIRIMSPIHVPFQLEPAFCTVLTPWKRAGKRRPNGRISTVSPEVCSKVPFDIRTVLATDFRAFEMLRHVVLVLDMS